MYHKIKLHQSKLTNNTSLTQFQNKRKQKKLHRGYVECRVDEMDCTGLVTLGPPYSVLGSVHSLYSKCGLFYISPISALICFTDVSHMFRQK